MPQSGPHDPYDSQMFSLHPNVWSSSQQQHTLPSNPYPPSQIAHKVWIIDCRSCGTFFTNRGMKAVLLLRPNVSLFSTDALPINCSADTTSLEAHRSSESCSVPSQMASRTCECLTQTLHCHGCGATVGYMIVIPCFRCTSSVTATNRATNGHRFVFHASEIVGTERHYIADEPGVIPFDPPFLQPMVPQSGGVPASYMVTPTPGTISQSTGSHPLSRQAYLPTPPLDTADMSPIAPNSHSSTGATERDMEVASPTFSVPSQMSSRPTSPTSEMSDQHATLVDTFSYYLTSQSNRPGPTLKPGDVVFWHHLVRHGEIPGVFDNPLARLPRKVKGGSLLFER